MTSQTVEQAKELLQNRLAEIERERKQLEHALSSLGSSSPRRSASKAGGGTRRRRSGGKRARRGQREAEFLDQVKNNPGAKISEIAGTMGVAPQQLYPIARRLSAGGKVTKKGDGFQIAA